MQTADYWFYTDWKQTMNLSNHKEKDTHNSCKMFQDFFFFFHSYLLRAERKKTKQLNVKYDLSAWCGHFHLPLILIFLNSLVKI